MGYKPLLGERTGESGTVIGEEEQPKGKCGGGEALEAVEAHGRFRR
jgi:hypothetical protein